MRLESCGTCSVLVTASVTDDLNRMSQCWVVLLKHCMNGKVWSDGGNRDLNGRGFCLCAAPSLVESGVH
jgi:hypothetical protein